MHAILVNHNFTPTWLLDSGLDYFIYDRSDTKDYLKDFPPERVKHTDNVGQVDYDKLRHLHDHYDDLPDVFLWGKTNLFKYITEEEWNKIKDNREFTPLLTQNHKTYADNLGVVCYYQDGMYYERNDSWYSSIFPSKYYSNYKDFAHDFALPNPHYLPFAPGGNYILTKEAVYKYSRDFYKGLAEILPYAREPVEAQMCERSYYNIWK